jgi:hypothetical protein
MNISELLKKVPRVIRSQWIHFEYNISRKISLNWFDIARYQMLMGERPNLKNPQTWSEKLLWLNRHWQPDIKAELTDKIKVRDYIKKQGLEFLLVPLIGIWESPNEIEFDKLPEKFVLKCNHGSATNVICRDKSKLDIEETKIKLSRWLKIDYGKLFNEKHYSKIKPMILCEEFLPALDGQISVIDYKIHCFNGEPQFIEVLSNRDNDIHKVTFIPYSLNWEYLDWGRKKINHEDLISKPKSIKEMIKYARILSQPFPFVRVDFYEIDGKPLLSELTFTPAANIDSDYKMEVHRTLGGILELPKLK